MQLFDMRFGDFVGGVVDDIVDATEVVDGLHNVVDARVFCGDPNGVGLKNVSGLFLGQATALDMIGIVSQVDLYAMVDAAFHLAFLLLSQYCKQRGLFLFASFGQHGIRWDVPCFSRQESTLNLSGGAVIARRTLADVVLFGKLTD